MGDISFVRAMLSGSQLFGLLVAICMIVLTGSGVAYAASEMYGAPSLEPTAQYFGSSNERWLKWLMPPGEPMYGSSGTCGAVVTNHFDGVYLRECPSGCTCHASYEGMRARFNACMGNMTRHRAFTPHVDCDGTLAAHRHFELHGFTEGTTDGEVCNFVSKEAFLESCEARTSFADRRRDYGWTLLVTLGTPCILWAVLLLVMLCGWRGRVAAEFAAECERLTKGGDDEKKLAEASHTPSEPSDAHDDEDEPKSEGKEAKETEDAAVAYTSDKAMGAMEAALDNANTAVEKAETVDAALAGDLSARLTLAQNLTQEVYTVYAQLRRKPKPEQPPKPGKWATRLAAMRNSAWFKFGMWMRTHTMGVGAQLLAFSNPTAQYILEPLLLACLICLHVLLAPSFYFLGDRLRTTQFVVETLISIGYMALSFLPFLRLFLEAEGEDELILEYEELTAWQLFCACLAMATPLLTVAIAVHAHWGMGMRELGKAAARSTVHAYSAIEVTTATTTTTTADVAAPNAATAAVTPPTTCRPRLFRACAGSYLLLSYAVGVYLILAIAQVRPICGWHRTCADPGCTPSSLPYGLTSDVLPWTNGKSYPDGENFYTMLQAFRIDPGTGREWTWHNRVGFKYTLGFENAGSEVLMNLDMWEQEGYSPQRSVTRRALPNDQGGDQVLTVQDQTPFGEHGRCTMQFALQCQEAEPALAFKDTLSGLDALRFVRYKPGYWKAVLQAPYPSCWTSTDPSDPASGWWADLLTFGPDLAVGSDADGTKQLGMVLTTGDCDATADGAGRRQLEGNGGGGAPIGGGGGLESADQEPAQKRCLSQANDLILGPQYGRNPARGDWSFAQSTIEMPDAWTSSSFAMTFEVQSHLLSGYVATCNGPGTCQAITTQAECEGMAVSNSNGVVEACSWGLQGGGHAGAGAHTGGGMSGGNHGVHGGNMGGGGGGAGGAPPNVNGGISALNDANHPPPDGNHPPPDGNHPPPNGNHPPPDGNHPPPDGNHPPPDGNHPPPDGNHPPPDGNHPPPDGNHPPPDGNHPPPDGNHPPPDGNHPPPDGSHPPPHGNTGR